MNSAQIIIIRKLQVIERKRTSLFMVLVDTICTDVCQKSSTVNNDVLLRFPLDIKKCSNNASVFAYKETMHTQYGRIFQYTCT